MLGIEIQTDFLLKLEFNTEPLKPKIQQAETICPTLNSTLIILLLI